MVGSEGSGPLRDHSSGSLEKLDDFLLIRVQDHVCSCIAKLNKNKKVIRLLLNYYFVVFFLNVNENVTIITITLVRRTSDISSNNRFF